MIGDDLEVLLKEDDRRALSAYVPAVKELPALAGRRAIDALILLTALGTALEAGLRSDARLPATSVWFAVPAVILVVLPLLGWGQHGFAAGTALWILGAGLSFIDGRLVVTAVGIQAAAMIASYLMGKAQDLRQAQVGLAIVISCAVIVVSNDPNRTSSEFFFVPSLFVVAWVAGFVLRQRTAQGDEAREHATRLELEQEEQVRRTIAEERARIARELHDVVGHCVSVMTVQAAGVRRMLNPEQDQEREALMAVERVGREALAEMRRLVGMLRYSSPELAPQPTLRDLDALVAHARDSGLLVDVSVDGAASDLPASIDLTAYRIVQEGLTNTIRHAKAKHARVQVCWRVNSLDIEISDDGVGLPDGGREAGHGLLGMRERVDVFGGQLQTGPGPTGGFRIHARLPVTP
ncbi:MAG TPA: sensor histidine kinase [Frankiaceae bacterium]|jgi:signal transduction histidine kinase|nr:sensor histidine kinase [Frankiaceae bacterium]